MSRPARRVILAILAALLAASVGVARAGVAAEVTSREAGVVANAREFRTDPVTGVLLECPNPGNPDEKRAPDSPPAPPAWSASAASTSADCSPESASTTADVTVNVSTFADGGLSAVTLSGITVGEARGTPGDPQAHARSFGTTEAVVRFRVNQPVRYQVSVSQSGARPNPGNVSDSGVAGPRVVGSPFVPGSNGSGTLQPGEYEVEGFARVNLDSDDNTNATASFSLSLFLAPVVAGDFDWSVPSRFGADGDGDGLIDYYPPDGTLEITPSGGWRVDFLAGGATCDTSVTRTWLIDGAPVTAGDPGVDFLDPNACAFSYRFPEEGVYPISLEIRDRSGTLLSTRTREVIVQDWLVVSIGDSIASGEGNPDIPGPAVQWQNRQCHRSAQAGPALAAAALEDADSRTSVTFIHLACSGASINEGLLGSYVGQEPGPLLEPQVVQLADWVGNREVDALTISIGANDVRFSKIVQDCFIYGDLVPPTIVVPPAIAIPDDPECHVPGWPASSRDFFEANLTGLPALYTQLGAQLASPPVGLPSGRVYITEYMDPVRDDTGSYCDQEILEEAAPIPLAGISAAEAEWASTDMLVKLNQAVQNAASGNGWSYVGGIYSRFASHGYCSSDRWIVQLTESLAAQGNKDGTIHPSFPGHETFAERLAGRMTQDLYVGGDLTQPRRPTP